jgi:hypothetical protein
MRPHHGTTPHKRKIRYIDGTVQKMLLTGLVALEVGLCGGLAWVLHWQLNQTIETNLYRAHIGEAGTLLRQLLQVSLPLLGVFILANALALLLAQAIWHRYVNSMLLQCMALIDKTRRLDFSPDSEIVRHRYDLLKLSVAQRAKERHRLKVFRERMSGLQAEVLSSANSETVRKVLNDLEDLLPPRTW